MSLKARILSDLTAAMKNQDALRTSTLRMVKAALTNREIEKGGELTDEEIVKTLRSLIKQRQDAAEQYDRGNRPELAIKERAEIQIIESYLPQAATPEEIERAIAEAIAETGASSMRDMGKVMKAAQARLAGRNIDGRTVSEMVKAKLSQ
ncbi:MAG: glutamyl-tRNA amidotransferase [Pyrinomonas sp.]|uniref:GatB/YqeY domain-containing protein n=1 Tax=Pyrinomonas sp. TaxID=2080306 RepID=UPI003318797B